MSSVAEDDVVVSLRVSRKKGGGRCGIRVRQNGFADNGAFDRWTFSRLTAKNADEPFLEVGNEALDFRHCTMPGRAFVVGAGCTAPLHQLCIPGIRGILGATATCLLSLEALRAIIDCVEDDLNIDLFSRSLDRLPGRDSPVSEETIIFTDVLSPNRTSKAARSFELATTEDAWPIPTVGASVARERTRHVEHCPAGAESLVGHNKSIRP